MPRPLEGWKIRKRKGRRCYSVIFTAHGKQTELGTGAEDAERAAIEAARIYAEAQTGRRVRRRKVSAHSLEGRQLGEAGALWLNEVDGTMLDEETAKTYGWYFRAHFVPYFGTVEAITTERVRSYVAERLRHVKGSTVRKEVSCLRGFLAWMLGPERAPLLPSVPKRAHGTEHVNGKRRATELSPAEVRRLLLAVKDKKLRAFFTLLYETTLRPATLMLLSAPEHYRKGASELVIPAGADKNRLARTVPLSVQARKSLDSMAENGPIFGALSYRHHFARAREKALTGSKAVTAHPYDLRRAGITHYLERTGNLPGVQYLAGHKNPATTGRYVQASMRAAAVVVSRTKSRGP